MVLAAQSPSGDPIVQRGLLALYSSDMELLPQNRLPTGVTNERKPIVTDLCVCEPLMSTKPDASMVPLTGFSCRGWLCGPAIHRESL